MKTQRITALFLILALLFTACLFSSCQTTEPPVEEDPTDAATTEEATTEEMTTEDAATEEHTDVIGVRKKSKVYSTATIEDNFLPDKVFIGIQPYAHYDEYTPESFSEVGCVAITTDHLFPDGDRHLVLKLSTTSKEEVLQAMKLLMKREDVWYAHPAYLFEYD